MTDPCQLVSPARVYRDAAGESAAAITMAHSVVSVVGDPVWWTFVFHQPRIEALLAPLLELALSRDGGTCRYLSGLGELGLSVVCVPAEFLSVEEVTERARLCPRMDLAIVEPGRILALTNDEASIPLMTRTLAACIESVGAAYARTANLN